MIIISKDRCRLMNYEINPGTELFCNEKRITIHKDECFEVIEEYDTEAEARKAFSRLCRAINIGMTGFYMPNTNEMKGVEK